MTEDSIVNNIKLSPIQSPDKGKFTYFPFLIFFSRLLFFTLRVFTGFVNPFWANLAFLSLLFLAKLMVKVICAAFSNPG